MVAQPVETMIRFSFIFCVACMVTLILPQGALGQTEMQPCPNVLLAAEYNEWVLPQFDAESAWERAFREEEVLGKHLYGVVTEFQVDLAPGHSGQVAAAVRFPGVAGLALHFDDFHLPVGVRMWVTDAHGIWQEGPYDFRDNDAHGRIATGDVPGEVAVIRLEVPQGLEGEVRLHMEGVAGLFRDVHAARGGSQPCEVDVACPEITGWECQRDATVRLSIIEGGGSYLCSGAMVNTTALDCRQYMLTALHCASRLRMGMNFAWFV